MIINQLNHFIQLNFTFMKRTLHTLNKVSYNFHLILDKITNLLDSVDYS